MRRTLGVLLVVAVLVLSGCSSDPSAAPAPGGAKVDVDTQSLRATKQAAGIETCVAGNASHVDGGLPEVTLPCLGGGPDVNLASLEGPMVVSLWASWCQECKAELPILQAFHDDHGDRVPVLGIDYQDVQPAGALALARRSGVTYPLLADPQTAISAQAPFPALRGLPLLALVGADGTVQYLEYGAVSSEQELVDLVDQHLGISL